MYGFRQMLQFYGRTFCQICSGSRNFENSVVSPGRQLQALHSPLDQRYTIFADRTQLAYQSTLHVCIAVHISYILKSFSLNLPCFDDPVGNIRASFTRRNLLSKFTITHRRNLNVQIYPVEQRTTDSAQITLDHTRSTYTFLIRMVEKSTGTWVHGGNQHEAGRKVY